MRSPGSVNDPSIAIKNADNYMWFSVAMYLSQFDWSRTDPKTNALHNGQRIVPRNTPPNDNKARLVRYVDGDDGYKRRGFISRDPQGNATLGGYTELL